MYNEYITKYLDAKKFYKDFLKDTGFTPKKQYTKKICNRFMDCLIPYNREFEIEEYLVKTIEKINSKVNKQTNETIDVPSIMLFQKKYLKSIQSNKILNPSL